MVFEPGVRSDATGRQESRICDSRGWVGDRIEEQYRSVERRSDGSGAEAWGLDRGTGEGAECRPTEFDEYFPGGTSGVFAGLRYRVLQAVRL